jgi:hypothetical protein
LASQAAVAETHQAKGARQEKRDAIGFGEPQLWPMAANTIAHPSVADPGLAAIG